MTMVRDRYPLRGLLGDHGRAVGGLAVCLGLLLSVDAPAVITVGLGGLSLCFTAFAIRTLIRQCSTVVADDTGVRIDGPWPAAVAWHDVRRVGLRYYSPRPGIARGWRRQEMPDNEMPDNEMPGGPMPRSGWMQLDLSGPGRTVRIESTLAGFPAILDRVVERLRDGDVAANDVTRANLAALGLMAWTDAVDPAAPTAAGKEDPRCVPSRPANRH